MTDYKILVAGYFASVGESDASPEFFRFAKAVYQLADVFEKGGAKAAKEGRPPVTLALVRQYVHTKIPEQLSFIDDLADLLHLVWMNGYRSMGGVVT